MFTIDVHRREVIEVYKIQQNVYIKNSQFIKQISTECTPIWSSESIEPPDIPVGNSQLIYKNNRNGQRLVLLESYSINSVAFLKKAISWVNNKLSSQRCFLFRENSIGYGLIKTSSSEWIPSHLQPVQGPGKSQCYRTFIYELKIDWDIAAILYNEFVALNVFLLLVVDENAQVQY